MLGDANNLHHFGNPATCLHGSAIILRRRVKGALAMPSMGPISAETFFRRCTASLSIWLLSTLHIRGLESPNLISCSEIDSRFHAEVQKCVSRPIEEDDRARILCQCPRRASRLALCINAVLLLGGCGMNYRFCPPGTEKDPSRPFTTCKTTTPARNGPVVSPSTDSMPMRHLGSRAAP